VLDVGAAVTFASGTDTEQLAVLRLPEGDHLLEFGKGGLRGFEWVSE
jgi:hypothetical protein